MSEKQTKPEEKVTPEEYLKEKAFHAARAINSDSWVYYRSHVEVALALARKEGEERMNEIIERLRQTLLNAPFASSQSYDYGLKTAIGIVQSYLPEKGDNNGK